MHFEKSQIQKGMILTAPGGPCEAPIRKSRPPQYGDDLKSIRQRIDAAQDKLAEITKVHRARR